MTRPGFNKQSVIEGALVLTVAGIFIKLLGAVYRVPLGRLLGDEGLGIYGLPNYFYLLFFTLSSAGIPVAVARLVSEKMAAGRYRDAYRVFRLARFSMLVIGLVSSSILYFGAGWFVESGLVADPRCYNGLRAIAPVPFFAAITAAYRGLFQGVRNMTVVAVSQVADQVMLVVATLTLAYLFLPQGLDRAAAGGNLGALPGAVMAMVIMLLYHARYRGEFHYLMLSDRSGKGEGTLSLLKKIYATAIPISFASIAIAITGILDNKLIIDRLQLVGYTLPQATAFYGQFTQMAMPLVNVAIAFASSLGASLVPSVAEAATTRDYARMRRQVTMGVRLAVVFSLPAATGLFILAPNLTDLVFANREAGIPLAWVSWVVVFWSVHLVTSGVLQGLGRADIPVRSLLAGIVFKVAITYYLTPTPLGVRAAALGTVAMFVVSSLLNIASIGKRVGFDLNPARVLVRPAAAVLVMALAVLKVHGLLVPRLGDAWATLAAVGIGVVVYMPAIIMAGGISIREVEGLPGPGKKIARIMERFLRRR